MLQKMRIPSRCLAGKKLSSRPNIFNKLRVRHETLGIATLGLFCGHRFRPRARKLVAALPTLVRHFVTKYAREMNKAIDDIPRMPWRQ